jgi:hypothetical protein
LEQVSSQIDAIKTRSQNIAARGPLQAGAGSLQEHGGPGNGERLPQPGQARGRMFAD